MSRGPGGSGPVATPERPWVDSHCHLQPPWHDGDAEGALQRARDAGVGAMVCVGTDLASSAAAIGLAEAHADVWAVVGLHPHDAEHLDRDRAGLEALLGGPRVVGVGEAGFDLHYEHSPRADQDAAFRWQVRLAHELGLALVIHSREAWDDTFRVLDEEGTPARTVFHCFTGGPEEAHAALDRGAHLSFSGIVSFRNADDLRAAAALVPVDRLLVETDAPFLAPVPHRGRPNEPALLLDVARALGAATGMALDELAAATAANAARVFRRPSRPEHPA